MKIQGFKKATSEMNRPHCVLHTDRLYVVHHSFPITSSSILVRYMMTTKVSYQLVLMIFQFPKCGSCVDSMVVVIFLDALATTIPVQYIPYSYLVDPFFLTPTETICTSKPPFLTLGEKMRHAHFSQTSSKDSGTFFVTLAALLLPNKQTCTLTYCF